MLFVPAGQPKMLSKALGLKADGLILDLEDSVSIEKKMSARQFVAEALVSQWFGEKEKIVRINALATELAGADIALAVRGKPDTILLPKVERAEEIHAYDDLVGEAEEAASIEQGSIGLVAMIESPLGIINVEAIARASKRVNGLLFGAADFTRETRGAITSGRLELAYPLMRLLIAARAANIDALDTPAFDISDRDALEKEARQAKNMGYDGKAAIHPGQLEIINEIFSPTMEEIAYSRRVIEAFEKARADGKGVTQLDGKLIEHLHVTTAKRILTIAQKLGLVE